MKILYFGPIAEKGKPATGGYEAANRKNIDELRANGVEVIEYPNPIINKRFGKLGKLAYLKLFILPLGLLKYRNQKDVVLHVTPLYRNLATPAVFTEWFAKKLNIHVLLDIRAGSFIDLYKNHGKRQRRLMDKLLNYASRVTVEGASYVDSIKEVAGYTKELNYFPNVVDCSNLKYSDRGEGKLNVFYFGRITKAKGVDVMVDTINKLDARFQLFLAGNIASDVNKEALLSNNKITYLGMLSSKQLKETMRMMHFFIFPTRHPGEGQSNSLIEAMSEGLIPVVSDQGFCKEVVANCGKVLCKDSSAMEYAEAIKELSSKDLKAQGLMCIDHIRSNHNLKVEIEKLIKIYEELCNR